MSKRQTLRFAAGTPDVPRSSVWNLVADRRKADLYLGTRKAMGLVKMSLHRTDWRFAMTSQSGGTFPQTGTRLGKNWAPPKPFVPGWIQGPVIVVPHPGDHIPFPADAEDRRRRVVWVDGPPEDQMLTFTVLLAEPDQERQVPARVSDLRVGTLAYASGSAMLYARLEPMDAGTRAWTNRGVETMNIEFETSPEALQGAVMEIGSTPDGRPIIWELVLGPANVSTKRTQGA